MTAFFFYSLLSCNFYVCFLALVTGQRADEDVSKADSSLVLNGLGSLNETLLLCRFLDDFFQTIDELIETGNSEQIFQKAIQEQGRGQVLSFFSIYFPRF